MRAQLGTLLLTTPERYNEQNKREQLASWLEQSKKTPAFDANNYIRLTERGIYRVHADVSSDVAALDYIALHPEIRDVVISGGDPLSLSDDRLDYILGRLRAIPHVEIFRLGTRNLVTLPQRVTDDFVAMLRKHHPVYVNTHFNHPKECTAETFEAARKLADAGCALGNQMVLLKGVNDEPKTVMELNHKLLLMRVRPYYIYQCDLAKGISHFRTPIETGRKIMRALRGWTSGLANPHFVIDAPGGGGKVPLLPEYVESFTDDEVVLRNFKGDRYVYRQPGKGAVPRTVADPEYLLEPTALH